MEHRPSRRRRGCAGALRHKICTASLDNRPLGRQNPQLFAIRVVFCRHGSQRQARFRVMKPTPQCPHARHPVAFAIQVPAQTADPQHRLADRQFRWLHPFPKATPSTSTSSSLRTWSAPGPRGSPVRIAQQHHLRRHRHIDPHGLLQSVPGLQAKILHLTAALEHQVDLLDRPPTGVFPHHLPRLVRRRGRLERPEQPVCRPGSPPVARVPIPPPGSRSSARRADISGDPARTSLASTALPPPHAARGTPAFRLTSTTARHRTGRLRTASCALASGSSILRRSAPRQVPAEFLPLCFFRSPVVCAISRHETCFKNRREDSPDSHDRKLLQSGVDHDECLPLRSLRSACLLPKTRCA